MSKLIVIALVILMAVLASGCGEELMYKKCFDDYPDICYLSTLERSYIEINNVPIPLVVEDRIVGLWKMDWASEPAFDIRPDNVIVRFTEDGAIKGAWAYFGPYGIITEYIDGYTSFVVFRDFTEDGDVTAAYEVSETELVGEGIMERVYVYKGESL